MMAYAYVIWHGGMQPGVQPESFRIGQYAWLKKIEAYVTLVSHDFNLSEAKYPFNNGLRANFSGWKEMRRHSAQIYFFLNENILNTILFIFNTI